MAKRHWRSVEMSGSGVRVHRLVLGMLQTNCYMVVCPDTMSAIVIDPADSAERILAAAEKAGARIEQILLTHAHLDHIAGLPALRQATGARVLAHPLEASMLERYLALFGLAKSAFPPLHLDVELVGGEEVSIGRQAGAVIHTPGHTPGGLTLRVGGTLFTGDTLFAQGIGRTDLPGGDLSTLLQSIQRLFTLPDGTKVYPGHGPETSIGIEKTDNPYV